MMIQILINGIIIGSVYSLISIGFALIYNSTRVFNISYAGLFIIAPYSYLLFFNVFHLSPFFAISLSIFFTVLISLITEIYVFKPLVIKSSSLNISMVTSIGVYTIILNLISLFYGNQTQILSSGNYKIIYYYNLIISEIQLYQFFICIFIIISLILFLKYSNFGIKIRSMRDDLLLSSIIGIDIFNLRLIIIGLSSILVSVSSLLISFDVGIDIYSGMPFFLNAVVALIIGGIGKYESSVIGGFTLGILQSLAIWYLSSKWEIAATFLILILFLIFRPQGIIGEKKRMV